jgi:alpha-amylase
VRRAHPALSRGSHAALSTAGDLLVFLRRDEASGDAVVVAVNRGATPAEARFAAPSEWAAGWPRVLWPAGEAVAAEGEAVVAVPARAAVVLGMDQH